MCVCLCFSAACVLDVCHQLDGASKRHEVRCMCFKFCSQLTFLLTLLCGRALLGFGWQNDPMFYSPARRSAVDATTGAYVAAYASALALSINETALYRTPPSAAFDLRDNFEITASVKFLSTGFPTCVVNDPPSGGVLLTTDLFLYAILMMCCAVMNVDLPSFLRSCVSFFL
jgi:hypothetical protein